MFANKGLRKEIAKRKHVKRCRILGIDPTKSYLYKAQGKPCSCSVCSPYKYNRAKEKLAAHLIHPEELRSDRIYPPFFEVKKEWVK